MLSLQFILLSLTSIVYNFPPAVRDQNLMNIFFFNSYIYKVSLLSFNNNFLFTREQIVFSIGL